MAQTSRATATASGSVASVKWMRDLLDLIEVRGLSVSSIVVGDFRLQLASPWPARKPPAPPPPLSEQAEQVKSDVENAKSPALAKLSPERLARARKECKAVLGRVLSDDAIAEMVEAGQL